MKPNETLQASFDRLAQRLFKLQNSTGEALEAGYVPSHTISDMLNGGVLTCDPEDAQNYLYQFIEEVQTVKTSLPGIVNGYTFPNKVDFEAGTILEADEIKLTVLNNLTEELDYYLSQLNTILDTVTKRHESLGDDRFSNAGFKVKLNLKVEEVGSFFNLMRESGLIPTVKSDGTEFTKKELAVFIQKNFSCTTTDNISLDSLINSLNRSKSKAESVVEAWLEKLLEIAKIDP